MFSLRHNSLKFWINNSGCRVTVHFPADKIVFILPSENIKSRENVAGNVPYTGIYCNQDVCLVFFKTTIIFLDTTGKSRLFSPLLFTQLSL